MSSVEMLGQPEVKVAEYWEFSRAWLHNTLVDYTKVIEGRILTLLESTLTNKEQLKATKDIARQLLWSEWEPMMTSLQHYQAIKDEPAFFEDKAGKAV